MYKIVTLCICFIMFVALVDITADAVELCKVDLSCPGQAATKKGGDWSDFEVSGGCDGDRHDPRGRRYQYFFHMRPAGWTWQLYCSRRRPDLQHCLSAVDRRTRTYDAPDIRGRPYRRRLYN
ncbi:MAG: hypothetical protein ACYTEQ_04470 [Planctomycetota bacterium]|jgi:hypothetical protein